MIALVFLVLAIIAFLLDAFIEAAAVATLAAVSPLVAVPGQAEPGSVVKVIVEGEMAE